MIHPATMEPITKRIFQRLRSAVFEADFGSPEILDAIEGLLDLLPASEWVEIDALLDAKEDLVCQAIDAELDWRDWLATLEKEIDEMIEEIGLKGALSAIRGLSIEDVDREIERLAKEKRLLQAIRRTVESDLANVPKRKKAG